MKGSATHQVCNKHLKLLGNKATCCNCDEKTDCDFYLTMPDPKEKLDDLYNFKALAKAFADGDLKWHEHEWKEFIESIRKSHTSSLLEKVEGLRLQPEKYGRFDPIGRDYTDESGKVRTAEDVYRTCAITNQLINDIKALIKEE